jgi:hypothetical protein
MVTIVGRTPGAEFLIIAHDNAGTVGVVLVVVPGGGVGAVGLFVAAVAAGGTRDGDAPVAGNCAVAGSADEGSPCGRA